MKQPNSLTCRSTIIFTKNNKIIIFPHCCITITWHVLNSLGMTISVSSLLQIKPDLKNRFLTLKKIPFFSGKNSGKVQLFFVKQSKEVLATHSVRMENLEWQNKQVNMPEWSACFSYICDWLFFNISSIRALTSVIILLPLFVCCSNLVRTADLDIHSWKVTR